MVRCWHISSKSKCEYDNGGVLVLKKDQNDLQYGADLIVSSEWGADVVLLD